MPEHHFKMWHLCHWALATQFLHTMAYMSLPCGARQLSYVSWFKVKMVAFKNVDQYGSMISGGPFNLPRAAQHGSAWLSQKLRKSLEWATPLKNDGVNWDDDIPNIWKVIKFHGSKPPTRLSFLLEAGILTAWGSSFLGSRYIIPFTSAHFRRPWWMHGIKTHMTRTIEN